MQLQLETTSWLDVEGMIGGDSMYVVVTCTIVGNRHAMSLFLLLFLTNPEISFLEG